MPDSCAEGPWRLETRFNLGTLLSLACSLCVVAGLVTGLDARLGAVEDKLHGLETRVEKRMETLRQTAIKVERIEERVLGVQQTLTEIRDELRAQREAH